MVLHQFVFLAIFPGWGGGGGGRGGGGGGGKGGGGGGGEREGGGDIECNAGKHGLKGVPFLCSWYTKGLGILSLS